MKRTGLFLVLIVAVSAQAQIGRVTIAPKRLEFQPGQRSAEVALINEGDQLTRFRIQVVEKAMNELTQLVDLDSVPEFSAAKMVRYAPRSVTLEPRGKQVIRVFVRVPNGSVDGEYRSHLQFVAEPEESSLPSPEDRSESSGFSSKLIPLYALSIPIIVQVGTTSGTLELKDARWLPLQGDNSIPSIVMLHVATAGNRSFYGDVTIDFNSDLGGQETVLFQRKGIALYASDLTYELAFPLNLPPDFKGGSGFLDVRYTGRDGELWIDHKIPLAGEIDAGETETVDFNPNGNSP